MSAALALPQQDHRSSHSPLDAAHHRHYRPIEPSRGPIYSQQHSPMSSSPASARPLSGPRDESPRDRPRMDTLIPQQPTPTSHPQTISPTDSRPSESRPPLPPMAMTMPEIKTERAASPGSPPPTATPGPRRRPQRLDLNTSTSATPASGRPSAPLTAKESGSLSAMQEVATACLSPGFDTSDPKMRHQMERSREMADQQRAIIAQRQMKSGGKGAESSGSKPPADFGTPPSSSFSKPASGAIRKKAPPSSLSITAAGSYNTHEPRIVQSAPLHQSFTGLHRPAHPLSRQVLEHSHQHAMSYTPRQQEHIYSPHVSTPQSTRLPPISDVFANENLGSARPSSALHRSTSGSSAHPTAPQPLFAPINNTQPPLSASGAAPPHFSSQPNSTNPSPAGPRQIDVLNHDYPSSATKHESYLRSTASSHPSISTAPPPPPRPAQTDRDYRSAEEAVTHMTGGREDLLPKVVHYGGHQPPTPPSPLPPMGYPSSHAGSYPHQPSHFKVEAAERSGRRRNRDEYERDQEDPGADERERERERDRERDRERESHRHRAELGRDAAAGLGFGFGTWNNEGRARHSPETLSRRKDEFMTICARAWDLLHD